MSKLAGYETYLDRYLDHTFKKFGGVLYFFVPTHQDSGDFQEKELRCVSEKHPDSKHPFFVVDDDAVFVKLSWETMSLRGTPEQKRQFYEYRKEYVNLLLRESVRPLCCSKLMGSDSHVSDIDISFFTSTIALGNEKEVSADIVETMKRFYTNHRILFPDPSNSLAELFDVNIYGTSFTQTVLTEQKPDFLEENYYVKVTDYEAKSSSINMACFKDANRRRGGTIETSCVYLRPCSLVGGTFREGYDVWQRTFALARFAESFGYDVAGLVKLSARGNALNALNALNAENSRSETHAKIARFLAPIFDVCEKLAKAIDYGFDVDAFVEDDLIIKKKQKKSSSFADMRTCLLNNDTQEPSCDLVPLYFDLLSRYYKLRADVFYTYRDREAIQPVVSKAIKTLSVATFFEDESYHSQGAFLHVNVAKDIPIVLGIDEYVDSVFDNLGFIAEYGLTDRHACQTNLHRMEKIIKYVRRILDALLSIANIKSGNRSGDGGLVRQGTRRFNRARVSDIQNSISGVSSSGSVSSSSFEARIRALSQVKQVTNVAQSQRKVSGTSGAVLAQLAKMVGYHGADDGDLRDDTVFSSFVSRIVWFVLETHESLGLFEEVHASTPRVTLQNAGRASTGSRVVVKETGRTYAVRCDRDGKKYVMKNREKAYLSGMRGKFAYVR